MVPNNYGPNICNTPIGCLQILQKGDFNIGDFDCQKHSRLNRGGVTHKSQEKMKKGIYLFLILFLFSIPVKTFAAKYAGEFLALGVGARPLGMGGAFVAIANDLTAGYWNPGGLVQIRRRGVAMMHSETFGELLNHDYISYSKSIADTAATAIGVSLIRLGGGGIKLTALPDPSRPPNATDNRPYVIKESGHADYTLFFTYAAERGQDLSWGANAKLIYRKIADNSAFGLGADLGGLLTLGHFRLGLNLQDATTTLLAYDSGEKESILPTLKLGTAFQTEILRGNLTIATDVDLRFEGRKTSAQRWLGIASGDLHLGGEYTYREIISLRIGSDQGDLTAGLGLILKKFQVDTSFSPHKRLDNSYKVSAFFYF